MHSDTVAVRKGEELDSAALSEYLRDRIGAGESSIELQQFPHGHSNLVYQVRIGGSEYVLRRPPLGIVAPKAHDVAREYRVLRAVHPHFPEAPQVILLCEDAAVIGSPFFLMERRRGIVIRDVVPVECSTIGDHSQRISEAFVDCFARLHAIDIVHTGLSTLGRPERYVERQLQGWTDRWFHAKTEDFPELDGVIRWLHDRLPSSREATPIHNDYKLDNVMIGPQANRIEAVLDWEMATVGDPLADLGQTLCYWSWVAVAAQENLPAVTPTITAQPGWYTRDQFLQRYTERTGRDVTNIGYYEVLGVFKFAVILQQIYYRFRRGQTQDERFRDFDSRVRALVRLASAMIEKHGL